MLMRSPESIAWQREIPVGGYFLTSLGEGGFVVWQRLRGWDIEALSRGDGERPTRAPQAIDTRWGENTHGVRLDEDQACQLEALMALDPDLARRFAEQLLSNSTQTNQKGYKHDDPD